jgi:hypothetical protein
MNRPAQASELKAPERSGGPVVSAVGAVGQVPAGDGLALPRLALRATARPPPDHSRLGQLSAFGLRPDHSHLDNPPSALPTRSETWFRFEWAPLCSGLTTLTTGPAATSHFFNSKTTAGMGCGSCRPFRGLDNVGRCPHGPQPRLSDLRPTDPMQQAVTRSPWPAMNLATNERNNCRKMKVLIDAGQRAQLL